MSKPIRPAVSHELPSRPRTSWLRGFLERRREARWVRPERAGQDRELRRGDG